MNTTRVATAMLSISLGVAACGSSVVVTNPNTSPPSTLAGTSTTTSGPIRSAAQAATKWNSLHAASYSFHYAMQCFCRRSVGFVTVTDGVVTG